MAARVKVITQAVNRAATNGGIASGARLMNQFGDDAAGFRIMAAFTTRTAHAALRTAVSGAAFLRCTAGSLNRRSARRLAGWLAANGRTAGGFGTCGARAAACRCRTRAIAAFTAIQQRTLPLVVVSPATRRPNDDRLTARAALSTVPALAGAFQGQPRSLSGSQQRQRNKGNKARRTPFHGHTPVDARIPSQAD